MLDLVHYAEKYLLQLSEQYKANPKPASAKAVLSAMPQNYYFDVPEPVVVDKSRGWANQIQHITDYISDTPRIICPVRSIVDIAVSFLALIEKSDPDNYIDAEIRERGQVADTNTRFEALMATRGTIGYSYLVLRDAFRNGWQKYLLLVEYDDLVAEPQGQMNRIYDFIGVERHRNDLQNISNAFPENDSVYKLRDMHEVRSAVTASNHDRDHYLPKALQRRCRDLEFWRDN